MIIAIGVWQLLSILSFAVGTKLLDNGTSAKCPCGRNFLVSFTMFKKILGPLRDDGSGLTGTRGAKIVTALLFAIQLLPIFFAIDIYWRVKKYYHGFNCLAYQVSRTERS